LTSSSLDKVCPSNSASSRAQTKLALALPHVKRSLTTATVSTNNSSSQSKSTQISIESLQGGLDFNAALNRTRASGLLSGVFTRFAEVARAVLNSADGEGESWTDRGVWVDTIVWVGGGGRMGAAGASSALVSSGVLGEDVCDEDIGAPEEVLARGCALHGRGFEDAQSSSLDIDPCDVSVTRRTIGVIIPQTPTSAPLANGDAKHAGDAGGNTEDLGGQWIGVLSAETPLPARRTVRLPILSRSSGSLDRVAFEVWEVSEMVHVQRTAQSQLSDASDDDEPPEDIEERERRIRKEQYLGVFELPLSPSKPVQKSKEATGAVVEVRFDMDVLGRLAVRARQAENDWVTMSVGSAT
jgi:heat shock 70kDa protein 1/6/8